MQKIVLFFVFFISVMAGTVIWLKSKTGESHNKYKLADLEKRTIVQQQHISGSVVSMNEVDIVPHISGIIEKIFVVAGQHVKRGQPIAKIKLIASAGNKESAKANLALATIKYDLSNKEYIRAEAAYNKQIIPKSEFETVTANWMQAKEEMVTATKQFEIVESGYIAGENGISDIITATISGVIVDVSAKEGSSVIERNNFNNGTVIATIADMDKLVFKGKVSEQDIQTLRQGMSFSVKVPALNNSSYPAEISYIGAKGTDENGLIRFDLEGRIISSLESSRIIRIGYSGIGEVNIASVKDATSVEEKNIIYKGDSSYVEIVDKNKKTKQSVKLGICDGIYCEVKSGLSVGHKIVIQE